MSTNRQINISTDIIFRTILILLAAWFLYVIRDIIALLFISVVIVSAIDPAVDWLQKKKVPRSVSVLTIYALLIVIIGFSISFLIPPISNQIKEFTANYSQYLERIDGSFGSINSFLSTTGAGFSSHEFFGSLRGSLFNFSSNIFSTTVGFFSGVISTVVVFSLTFYMAAERDAVNHFIVSITPERHKKYASNLTERIKVKIGKWMLGQFFLMLIIFALDYVGLTIIGIPYALILAIFAGVMEIVPYVGPIISAVPGVFLGFLISPTVGLLAILVYVAAQQFENHVIVPQVMKKAVGLNPIAVILALLIGLKLAGVLGAILAIPAATAISLFIGDLMEKNES